MNNKPSSKKSIIAIVVIVAIAGLIYFYYNYSSGGASGGNLSVQSVSESEQAGAEVLSLLNQIQGLRIDTKLFDDPGFKSLQDFTVAIPPQNVGRINPFAPIPGVPSGGSPSGR